MMINERLSDPNINWMWLTSSHFKPVPFSFCVLKLFFVRKDAASGAGGKSGVTARGQERGPAAFKKRR